MSNPVITKVTIARLHNLGHYEHNRYEVSVDIPEGNHAGAVIEHVTDLLDALEPKCPVDDYQLQRALEIVRKPEADLDQWDLANLESSKAMVAKFQAWKEQRRAAHEALGNLPVVSTYKDAKEDWNDEA